MDLIRREPSRYYVFVGELPESFSSLTIPGVRELPSDSAIRNLEKGRIRQRSRYIIASFSHPRILNLRTIVHYRAPNVPTFPLECEWKNSIFFGRLARSKNFIRRRAKERVEFDHSRIPEFCQCREIQTVIIRYADPLSSPLVPRRVA